LSELDYLREKIAHSWHYVLVGLVIAVSGLALVTLGSYLLSFCEEPTLPTGYVGPVVVACLRIYELEGWISLIVRFVLVILGGLTCVYYGRERRDTMKKLRNLTCV
jgi:hypothetical protein